eukprot:TRINITY_DN10036_c0_g1_i1.p1 TRINITY_DN10036_c0_g1~~TRINITY_DN10036_c0_g1_i1.p1  ORF type:complete len:122 (+),score=26.79 TRINITY_DN10036_c0_g1_i1:170-535(+)
MYADKAYREQYYTINITKCIPDDWKFPPDLVKCIVDNVTEFVPAGDLFVGALCDVEDKQKKWCECEVVQESSTHFKISYLGWGSQFDEWVPKTSPRITQYREMTSRSDVPKYGPRPHKYNT